MDHNNIYYQQGQDLLKGFATNSIVDISEILNSLLDRYIGIRDIDKTHEYLFHMFLNGMFSLILTKNNNYCSNKEAGDGYSDIRFKLRQGLWQVGVVLELKNANSRDELQVKAREAFKQCHEKRYYENYTDDVYIKEIYLYGIAFYNRTC